MIYRSVTPHILKLSEQYPVITVTGPRQSGKTTLCRSVFDKYEYANLELPDIREYASTDPRAFLNSFKGPVIIDEIQRLPQLLSYIQAIVDEKKQPGQFILTGSQNLSVSQSISQSLAGRTAIVRLLPFSISEIKNEYSKNVDEFLHAGFYPRIYDMNLNPNQAIGDYIVTYVEKDVRQLSNIKDLSLFHKFLQLCAGRVGQLLNMNSIANDIGVSHVTIREWISILEAGFIIFLLQPFYANIGKRLIKTPKFYFYDVGLASYLLGIEKPAHLLRHPLRGNLFENLVISEVLKYRYNSLRPLNLFFFRDSNGQEVDLLYKIADKLVPIEIKSSETVTNALLKNLRLFEAVFGETNKKALIYSGLESQHWSGISIVPFNLIDEFLKDADDHFSDK